MSCRIALWDCSTSFPGFSRSYPPYGAREGRVGENLGNEVGDCFEYKFSDPISNATINSPPKEAISFPKQSRATSKWPVPSLFSVWKFPLWMVFFFRFNLISKT